MRRHVRPASALQAQSLSARNSPGWVIDDGYPGEIFVLGRRVVLGDMRRSYRPATLAACYLELKAELLATAQFVPRGIIVAVEAGAAGILLADESLRGRLQPQVKNGGNEIAFIGAGIRFGNEKAVLRITPGLPIRPELDDLPGLKLGYLVPHHPHARSNARGLWL